MRKRPNVPGAFHNLGTRQERALAQKSPKEPLKQIFLQKGLTSTFYSQKVIIKEHSKLTGMGMEPQLTDARVR